MTRAEAYIARLEALAEDRARQIERLKSECSRWQGLAQHAALELAALKTGHGEPVAWQFYQDGQWWNGEDRIKDHRVNTAAAGYPVRDLYASPLATGWLCAIDAALITAHLGTANAGDTFREAEKKLRALIDWHVAVATDPEANGGQQLVPIELLTEAFQIIDRNWSGAGSSEAFVAQELRALLAGSAK